jgi:hypothetical protein
MRSAIVTGANGFVGSEIVRNLVNHGFNVYALYNRSKNRLETIEKCRTVHCPMDQFSKIPEKIQDSPDFIFHCAWSGSSGEDRTNIQLQLSNVTSTCALIEAAKIVGAKRVIVAGSIMEDEVKAVTDSNGSHPSKSYIYGAAKYSAHMMAKPLAVSLGVDLIWAKITNAYGVGELSPRMLNSTIRKCINLEAPSFTAATQNYDFIYVTDVAEAFRLIAEKGSSYSEYVVGSGEAKPLRNFLEDLRLSIGNGLPFLYGNIPYTGVNLPLEKFSTEPLFRDTSFKTQIPFPVGVALTRDWLKEQEN